MADEDILNIRISELPETSTVDKDNDFLPVVKPSTAYTSGYKTFKVTPDKLLAEAVEYTAGDHIAISANNEISATYQAGTNITIAADGTISAAGGGASALDDLTDVAIDDSTLATGQYLKYNGTSWVNSSGSGGSTSADDVTYNNTTSGLTATNVQDAIDELSQGSGGSTVTVTQIQSTGTKIATITVDSVDTDLYAPTGGGASAFEDLTDVDIDSATLSNGQIPVYNATTEKWENGSLRSSIYTDLTDTLEAGEISLTISDAIITTSSIIDIYTDGDVPYNSLTVSNGSITIAFESQASDMGVKVRVWVTPPEAEGSAF